MFADPAEEDRLISILKAFCEELNSENVIVSLPKSWYNPDYTLGKTKLEFTTENTIEIKELIGSGYGRNFKVNLTI